MKDKATVPIRVGAVSFLNTRPLVRYLDTQGTPKIRLTLEVPSRLADMMQASELDVALLPSIEYFRGKDYRILPGISLSSNGMVLSVRIYSKVPLESIRKLALDTSSRTSVALTKVLLKRNLGSLPNFVNCSPTTSLCAVDADAILLIGDPAMAFHSDEPVYTFDLGEEWKKLTGLPFVYAMWVAKPDVELGGLHLILLKARDEGLTKLAAIAAEASRETGLREEVCFHYLKNIMKYGLGEPEIEALRVFQKLAAEDGLCPGGVGIAIGYR